jgi:hypothetical protein
MKCEDFDTKTQQRIDIPMKNGLQQQHIENLSLAVINFSTHRPNSPPINRSCEGCAF